MACELLNDGATCLFILWSYQQVAVYTIAAALLYFCSRPLPMPSISIHYISISRHHNLVKAVIDLDSVHTHTHTHTHTHMYIYTRKDTANNDVDGCDHILAFVGGGWTGTR
uniref:Uncharacterized protein n=1 Tax=Trypanosoma vivax (strain Y486) TaxID=1055687 RepID=G0U8D8_TRYVY|nr:hypothetical protein, unlikely [Trypanosoma vivax Y486]